MRAYGPSLNALVLLSGGQDSTTAMLWADKDQRWNCLALFVNYGQRSLSMEQRAVQRVCREAEVPWTMLDCDALAQLRDSSLVKNSEAFGVRADNLPTSFVPGRNILFLALAGAMAKKLNIPNVVIGLDAHRATSKTDAYPDCSMQFVRAMEEALRIGLDMPCLEIHAPLVALSKAAIWAKASALNVTNLVVNHTRTCYEGGEQPFHEWGYGCGACPACKKRSAGFAAWKQGGKA
jgi:7-cyano-7-deazaguanine synthase